MAQSRRELLLGEPRVASAKPVTEFSSVCLTLTVASLQFARRASLQEERILLPRCQQTLPRPFGRDRADRLPTADRWWPRKFDARGARGEEEPKPCDQLPNKYLRGSAASPVMAAKLA